MTGRSIAGIVDYNSGNIRSIINAVENVGAKTELVRTSDSLSNCTHLILPGVGAFGFCAEQLRACGMLPAIEQWALKDSKPLLGICVGMQLMAEFSEEHGEQSGLDWIGGTVRKLEEYADNCIRVPHVGWNEVVFKKPFGLFSSGECVDFYFDHSFAYQDFGSGEQLGICRHGIEFSAIIRKNNILAVQFHPEKSQTAGMRFLKSFLTL